ALGFVPVAACFVWFSRPADSRRRDTPGDVSVFPIHLPRETGSLLSRNENAAPVLRADAEPVESESDLFARESVASALEDFRRRAEVDPAGAASWLAEQPALAISFSWQEQLV